MIVSIGNQKGGVGKTTLAILLSNFLTENEKDLLVVDFDFQTSFYSLWEEQKNLHENAPKYEVIKKDLTQSKEVISMAESIAQSAQFLAICFQCSVFSCRISVDIHIYCR